MDADEKRSGDKPSLHEPDHTGFGMKSRVGVYLLELVRLIQYKWGTIFRHEWFWRMEELTERNGKGIWLRKIENVLKCFTRL